MKKPITPRALALAALAFSAFAATPSAFAQGTFTPGTGSAANCNPSSSTVASYDCSVGSVSVTMTTSGYMDSTNGWKPGMLGDFGSNGFGAYTGNKETSNDGQHAFDNLSSGCSGTPPGAISGLSGLNGGCGGTVEALLLNFGASSVKLTQVGIGYFGTDADISVFRWTGTGTPTLGAVGTSGVGGSIAGGWTLVASKDMDGLTRSSSDVNYDAGNTQTRSWNNINSGYSSAFLITTYFGAASTTDNTDPTQVKSGSDRFKLNSFTVACNGACTPSQASGVSEPASLALASLGLVAGVGVRRRSQRKPA